MTAALGSCQKQSFLFVLFDTTLNQRRKKSWWRLIRTKQVKVGAKGNLCYPASKKSPKSQRKRRVTWRMANILVDEMHCWTSDPHPIWRDYTFSLDIEFWGQIWGNAELRHGWCGWSIWVSRFNYCYTNPNPFYMAHGICGCFIMTSVFLSFSHSLFSSSFSFPVSLILTCFYERGKHSDQL